MIQKISPFLWFDGQAEEAAEFYTSIFKDSEIESVWRCGEEGPGPAGSALVLTFQLEGQHFMALNGGPEFAFTPAISFMVHCETQEEVDYYWEGLLEGGKPVECGWLTDKFGVSWQIVPNVLGEMLQDKDSAKAGRAMKAMMQMVKLDIAGLKAAYESHE